METRPFQFTGRIRSFRYAIAGIIRMVRCQHNAWIHVIATGVVIATLALALPLKFANYQLVAIAISCGQAKARLAAAARVGVFSLILTAPAAVVDVRLVPAVVVASEALLLMQLRRVQRRTATLSPRMAEA